MKKQFLTILAPVLLACSCNYSVSDISSSDDTDTSSGDDSDTLSVLSSCDIWEQYEYEQFVFENNQWNSSDAGTDDYFQCITLTETSTSEFTPSWSWEWPYGGGSVKAYPEIWYGDKFGTASPDSDELPEVISSLEDYNISFSYSETDIDSSDARNVAFESWFFPTEDVSFDEVEFEMMVWVNRSDNIYPAGSLVESVTFSDGTYDLYLDYFDDWTYFAYVRQDYITEGSLNWNEFVNHLVDEGYISSSYYMSVIEFGTEIIYGSGEFQIDHFVVDHE
jgi:hypothetical protein